VADDKLDLDEERRAFIDAFFARRAGISHYEVLGVAAAADKKELKRAYFRLVGLVHPDRYFGKNVGSYKAKIEAIFARVSDAYETLSDPARRKEYDDAHPDLAPAAPKAKTPAPPPPPDPVAAARKREAMAALKARFLEGTRKAQTHAEAAARARAAGDLAAAVEAYGAALKLAPTDAALRAAYDETQALVRERLAGAHATQAALAERLGRWDAAVQAWRRVVEAHPDDETARARLAAAIARAAQR
jgi:curved DNA-binding protein CbpA